MILDFKDDAVECPMGWTYFKERCYNMYPAEPYVRGVDTCRRESAHLVTVTSQEHMTFIYQAFL